MVILDFQLELHAIEKCSASDLRTADEGFMAATYFQMPVRFSVDNVELLELPINNHGQIHVFIYSPKESTLIPTQQERQSSPWLPLPILDVAVVGLDTLRQALVEGVAIYPFIDYCWHLRFEVLGKDVLVYSKVNGRTARVSHEELLCAFNEFASKVRNVLRQEAPELNDHPYWGKWLRNEIE